MDLGELERQINNGELVPRQALALVARVRELEAALMGSRERVDELMAEVSDLRASMSVAIQEQRAAAAAEARERALEDAAGVADVMAEEFRGGRKTSCMDEEDLFGERVAESCAAAIRALRGGGR